MSTNTGTAISELYSWSLCFHQVGDEWPEKYRHILDVIEVENGEYLYRVIQDPFNIGWIPKQEMLAIS